MAATVDARADGVFDAGDGSQWQATAELSQNGLAVVGAGGEQLALWKPRELLRTMGSDGFRIGSRLRTGVFVFDPRFGGDLIRALAVFPDAGAPASPRNLVSTMALIVIVVLTSLFVLAWGFFWLAEWLLRSGVASGRAG